MSGVSQYSTSKSRQAFFHMRCRGEVPAGLLPAAIEQSWRRCISYGVADRTPAHHEPAPRASLDAARHLARSLCKQALPVMETLYEQIADSDSMLVLADADGLILHSLGDADFLPRAERVALTPGSDWSEKRRGTNAIGSALVEQQASVVHGQQHFVSANHFLTCSAVPVLDPHGEVAGVLDVSGDCRQFSRHTLGLVRLMARQVENQLFLAAFPQAVLLQFHARAESADGLLGGIIAVAPDGSVLSGNRAACQQLGTDLATLRRARFEAVFDTPLRQVLDHVMRSRPGTLGLLTRTGAPLAAHARAGSQMKSALKIFTYSRDDDAEPAWPCPARDPSAAAGSALGRLMTGDERVNAVIAKMRRVLGRDIPVLIYGETGAGKELLARALHDDGPRRGKPLVAVNCAAIPDGLIESELFGYEDGAFSGARRKGSIGHILKANGGTLFLDEIGDMPLGLQARLLRVLQERTVNPLGSTRSIPVDINVICATHHRLKEAVAAGRFRADLYYRLNGLAVTLPPLRQRSDLPQLVELLLARETGDGAVPAIDPEVMAIFCRHTWPGNIRQLCNVLRTARVMAGEGGNIGIEHLPEDFLDELSALEQLQRRTADEDDRAAIAANRVASRLRCFDALKGDSVDLESVTLEIVGRTLDENGGNVSAAARQLGISRNTLYRKLRQIVSN